MRLYLWDTPTAWRAGNRAFISIAKEDQQSTYTQCTVHISRLGGGGGGGVMWCTHLHVQSAINVIPLFQFSCAPHGSLDTEMRGALQVAIKVSKASKLLRDVCV